MRYETNHPYYQTEEDTLKHDGVIGMKWGVWNEETRARRLRERIGRKRSKNTEVGSKPNLLKKITNRFSNKTEDKTPHLKRTHLTKDLAEISDEELNAAIKRMQLEQTYLNMVRQYPDASDKGKKYADKFTDQLFSNLSDSLGSAMGRRVAKAIDDWINNDDNENNEYQKYRKEAESMGDEAVKKANQHDAAVDQYAKNQVKKNKK